MRITIDTTLFLDDRHSVGLTNLLCGAVRRPHQLLVGPHGRDRVTFEHWLGRQGAGLHAPLRALLDRSLDPEFTRAPPEVALRVSEADDERVDDRGRNATVSLRRAIELTEMPLRLVLENGVNDAAFLRKAAPPGELRDWLEYAVAQRWIEFINGGGSFLHRLLASYGPWQRLRAWALCDAEAWTPRSISGIDHRQVATFRTEAARAPRVPLEVLERRAIENYIPLSALKRWAHERSGTRREERQRRAHFTEALTPLDARRPPHTRFALRHHYHLERGFGAATDEIPPDYDDFRDDPALASGIGDEIKQIWASTAREPYGSAADWLDDAWLAADGQRPEIQRIVASIKSRV